ncbi:ABC transporter permease [Rhizobium leguminosarum bv. trifolii]|uniref:ABC transporter permease n=1 Tax=Rhizobium leguminosarum TaxID=384 RepID=UPI000E2FA491|nr:ABC transporter permease [Rhizobium leguminosarum]RFB88701.1 ABC transporter permease [Rhizobium leguminosarum bv. trifolii]
MNTAALLQDVRRERRFFLSLAAPALVLVGLAAILPVMWILRQSFLTMAGDLSTANYEKILSSGLTWSAVGTTLALSGATLFICMVLGIPLALTLASAKTRIANRVLILIMLPLWTSILVRTYGWLVLLRRDGLVNSALQSLGLTDTPLPLAYNFTGTLIGMVHYMLPLFVLPIYAAMRDIDNNVIRASASMGASFWHCVRTVILPLSAGGILSGSTIVFIYTLGFFITPAILGGGKVNPISVRIDRTLSTFQDWGSASALGVLLLVLVLVTGGMLFGLRSLLTKGARHA